MKKVLCILMVALMLIGTAFAEEEFTLHNGTKFGMTADEVISLENQKGLILSLQDYFWFAPDGNNPSQECERYSGSTTVASIKDTYIGYDFSFDSLFHMIYYFTSSKDFDFNEFDTIEHGLQDKYGRTDYTYLSGLFIPSINVYTEPADRSGVLNNEGMIPYDSTKDFQRDRYSHRLIPLQDGCYVLIDHVVYHNTHHYDFEKDKRDSYSHVLHYYFLTLDEVERYFSLMNQINNDL